MQSLNNLFIKARTQNIKLRNSYEFVQFGNSCFCEKCTISLQYN